ncbi:transcription factor bHLH13-like [Nymphaea colorata]|uniref:transcription factor bHLH13-like n=1 Tax=Nymphaea colorata TaxID=210225 RepID=UPI00129E505C|nr:transcription factor bHLH13-like [Nymphaea colorata]
MDNFDPTDNFMNVETEAEERDAPEAGINLMGSFPFLPLDGAFDINSCLPQTPFYEAPFADLGSQQIGCSSSEQEGGGHHQHDHAQPLLSSPTNLSGSEPSRSLVSERKRRGRMKEKLLALRSLVPNITKMDKASIIGDATAYVQELQKEATKLSEEIVQLECCLEGGEGRRCELDFDTPKQVTDSEESLPCRILQIERKYIDEEFLVQYYYYPFIPRTIVL